MKSILKNILIYIIYLIITILIFYVTGMYIWTTPPTKLVLIRIIIIPLILTFITIAVIKIKNNIHKKM